MKYVVILLFLFSSSLAFAHSGNTNASGCHMDYTYNSYHCHQSKIPSPFKTYYYIHDRGNVYGPYSSHSSCNSARLGANMYGAYCSTSKY